MAAISSGVWSSSKVSWWDNPSAPYFANIGYGFSVIESGGTFTPEVTIAITAQGTGSDACAFYGRGVTPNGSYINCKMRVYRDGSGEEYAPTDSSFSDHLLYSWGSDWVRTGTNLLDVASITVQTRPLDKTAQSIKVMYDFEGCFCFGARRGEYGSGSSWTSTNPFPGSTIKETATVSTFKVSFVLNGGTGSYPSAYTPWVSGEKTSYVLPSSTPTRTGYRFSGWYNPSDKKIYGAGETVTLSTGVTFTAQWEATDFENVSSVSINKNTVTSTNELPSSGVASTAFSLSWACNTQNVSYYDIAFEILYGKTQAGGDLWSGLYWYGQTTDALTQSYSIKLTDANLKVQSSYNHRIDPNDPANNKRSNYDTISLSDYTWKAIRFYVRSVGVTGTQDRWAKHYLTFTTLSLALADVSTVQLRTPPAIRKVPNDHELGFSQTIIFGSNSNLLPRTLGYRSFWCGGSSPHWSGVAYVNRLESGGESYYEVSSPIDDILQVAAYPKFLMTALKTVQVFDVVTKNIQYQGVVGYEQVSGDRVAKQGSSSPVQSPWRFYPRPLQNSGLLENNSAMKMPNVVAQYDGTKYRLGVCWVYHSGWKLAKDVFIYEKSKWCDTTYTLDGNTLWDGE